MKKVKMLTFHNVENYGANLQAYALKEKIKELGADASFVNYQNEHVLKEYRLIKTKSLKAILASIWNLKRNINRKNNFTKFCNKYLDGTTKKYYTADEIGNDSKKDEIYIAGSDQIFNPNITNGVSDVYTLNFGKNNIKRVAYAASVGDDSTLDEYAKDFKEKLKKIDAVSVREASIAGKLSEVIGKDVKTVLDPTLLLEKEKWDKLIEENKVHDLKDQKYILVYILFKDPEVEKIVNYLSEKTGLKVIHFRRKSKKMKELMSYYEKGPADFLNVFKNAEYIVTNSFHGLIFSIMFERKFFALMPKERAGRLKDLMKLTGLEKRSVAGLEDVKKLDIDEEIDFKQAKANIEEKKKESIEYLKDNLGI